MNWQILLPPIWHAIAPKARPGGESQNLLIILVEPVKSASAPLVIKASLHQAVIDKMPFVKDETLPMWC